MENPDEQRATGDVDSALRDAHPYNFFQLIQRANYGLPGSGDNR